MLEGRLHAFDAFFLISAAGPCWKPKWFDRNGQTQSAWPDRPDWKVATVDKYLQIRKLKLSSTKTMLAIFHLNKKETKLELRVNFNNKILPVCSESNTSE